MTKRYVAGSIAALLAAVLATQLAGPGRASGSYAQCPPGTACLYPVEDGGSLPVVEAFSTHTVGTCYTPALLPQGRYHSALGDYGWPHLFVIYLLPYCQGQSYSLANRATRSWSAVSGFTIQSFKIT